MAKWYQTRYAVRSGIVEVDGRLSESEKYVRYGLHGWDEVGVEIFATRSEAEADYRARLVKAIAAAKKKMATLEQKLEKLA